jgi:hypothetical protein
VVVGRKGTVEVGCGVKKMTVKKTTRTGVA